MYLRDKGGLAAARVRARGSTGETVTGETVTASAKTVAVGPPVTQRHRVAPGNFTPEQSGNRGNRGQSPISPPVELARHDQYRLTFRWEQGHAYEVRVEDDP
jgi:hypothetical protein